MEKQYQVRLSPVEWSGKEILYDLAGFAVAGAGNEQDFQEQARHEKEGVLARILNLASEKEELDRTVNDLHLQLESRTVCPHTHTQQIMQFVLK